MIELETNARITYILTSQLVRQPDKQILEVRLLGLLPLRHLLPAEPHRLEMLLGYAS